MDHRDVELLDRPLNYNGPKLTTRNLTVSCCGMGALKKLSLENSIVVEMNTMVEAIDDRHEKLACKV